MNWLLMTAVALLAQPDYVEVYVSQDRTADVFLSASEAETLQERMAEEPAFRKRAEQLLERAGGVIGSVLDIPRSSGLWLFYYTCPVDGTQLKYINKAHTCPLCGISYDDKRTQGAYRTFQHLLNNKSVEALGWAYALDPKPAYAERVREVLLTYAEFYRDLEQTAPDGRPKSAGGRLFSQTLLEAEGLLRFCVGYDRTRKAPCYSPKDRDTIERQLLRPMVNTIKPNERGYSNWQAWHNAAIGCAAYILNDGNLLDWAVNGAAGFLYQREHCIKDAGMWHEGSPTYHLYALEPYTYFFEAAARQDVNLFSKRVKRFYDAPLRYLLPDFTFPPLNNSDRRSILESAHLYEVAYRRYEDPVYTPLLGERNTPLALVWGAPSLPADAPETLILESMRIMDDGLAVLRADGGKTAAFLDFSGEGTVHTQPAKLGVLFFAHGDQRFVDPGRLSYNHPLHAAWYAHTVAHNAPVVNGQSQQPSAGRCTAFAVTDDFQAVRAACEDAYPNAILHRTLAQRGPVWIDVVQVFAGMPVQADLPLHLRGDLEGLPEAKPASSLGTDDGYDKLRAVEALGKPAFTCNLDTGDGTGIRITIADPDGAAYHAEGHGSMPTEWLPMILRRQEGRSLTFVAVYERYTGDPPPAIPIEIETGAALRVRADDMVLELGSTTIVETAGQRHYIGEDGVTGTRALAKPRKQVE
ncbi:MAG: alginate lyase family protein [Candidatus Hydrogenedentota bacterium]